MSELRSMTDDELGRALGELAGAIAWPQAPGLVAAVGDRIVANQATRRPWRSLLERAIGLPGVASSRDALRGSTLHRSTLRRSLILALVLVLAVVALATAFGIGVPGIRIFFAPVVNPTTPAQTSPASTVPSGSPLVSPGTSVALGASASPDDPTLGRLVTLDDARTRAGFGVLTPSRPGFEAPVAVHLLGEPPVARVTLSYGDRGSLTEFVGSADPEGFQKLIGGGTTVEALTLNGKPAYWISGAPHELVVLYQDATGVPTWESIVVDGDVLIWQDGDVTLRLSTSIGRTEAIAVAGSMR